MHICWWGKKSREVSWNEQSFCYFGTQLMSESRHDLCSTYSGSCWTDGGRHISSFNFIDFAGKRFAWSDFQYVHLEKGKNQSWKSLPLPSGFFKLLSKTKLWLSNVKTFKLKLNKTIKGIKIKAQVPIEYPTAKVDSKILKLKHKISKIIVPNYTTRGKIIK